jgi:O-succinylbenzoate synthase
MPLKVPFRSAIGEERVIETLFVRMQWGEHVGWGESTPQTRPFYSGEWATGAFALLRDCLAPMVVGAEVGSGEDLEALMGRVRGNWFAKAALDVAWWDAFGRSRAQPVWQLAGGVNPEVEVGADIPLQSDTDALIRAVANAIGAGYKRAKLKITRDYSEAELGRLRERFPDAALHVDCNGAFTLDDLPRLIALDAFGFVMIEQPLAYDDLVDHASLQHRLKTPICLDESITGVSRARKAIETGACGWINIKAGRVGGITPALAIHRLCLERGVPNWIGSMLDSDLGQAASLALATLPNVRYPADIFPQGTFYDSDVCEPPMRMSGPSLMQAPSRPGLGWQPNLQVLRTQLIESAVVRPRARASIA